MRDRRRSPGAPRARRRGRGPRLWLALACCIAFVAVIGVLRARHDRDDAPRRVVIVDQLSLTVPNPDWVARATRLLEDHRFTVDYVPGDRVTVEMYQQLPARGADLVVLRVHSARVDGPAGLTDDVALFTGELIDLSAYNVADVAEGPATAVAAELARLGQTRDGRAATARFSAEEMAHLIPVTYSSRGVELPYFGLRPEFVTENLGGRFAGDTVVVLMGCDGLRSQTLASAFVARGARAFISWDRPVSATHTDAATLDLLARLADGRTSPADAIAGTMAEVGPDPVEGARLATYP
jgi:hypothetical protein